MLLRMHVLLGAIAGVVVQLIPYSSTSDATRVISAAIFAGIAVDVWIHQYPHVEHKD